MNRTAVIKAAYYMAKALGQAPSRRNVNAVIEQQIGKGFRPSEIAAVLKTLVGNHLGTIPVPRPEPQLKRQVSLLGTTTGTDTEPATLINVSPKLEANASPAKPKRPKREPPPQDLAAYALTARAFDMLSEHLNLGIGKSEWAKRNNNDARAILKTQTQEAVLDLWTFALVDSEAKRFYAATSIRKLIEYWPKLEALQFKNVDERPGDPEWWLDMPDLAGVE